MSRPTIKDVARRANVSVGTVSHVQNRPELVAEATRSRVLAAIDELGFVWNGGARQLRGIGSRAIALVVLDFGNPFFTEVARGVEQAAAEADRLVILAGTNSVASREDRALRQLDEQRVAGIIMSPSSTRLPPRLREIRSHGTPVVLLDRHRSRRDQCSVAINDTSGAGLVAEHLLELGHRDIGLLNGPRYLKPCYERRDAFLAVLAQAGVELAPANDLETAMTIEAGEQAAGELFDQGGKRPTALFCGNDLMAIGAERAAIARGLRIPEDIAIVGYDDIWFAASSLVPLTSVHNPAYEMGFRAAELLIDEVTNAESHKHSAVLFEPRLVVRQSTTGLPGEGAAREPAAAEATAAASAPAA
jgi:LacI family transcriptional regulator